MLVQVMISAAIAGIVSAALSSMMTAQNRAAQAIAQKIGTTELQQLMSTAIHSGGACKAIVDAAGGAISFDAGAVGTNNPPAIPVQTIPMSSKTGASPLVTVGDKPSPMTNSLEVEKIELVVKSGGGAGQYHGEVRVTFLPSKLVMPINPPSVPVIFQTTGGAITDCKPEAAAGGTDLPGSPCTLPGDTIPRGTVTYNWSANIAPAKFCCMADPTTQNISYGAYQNGGFATFILACKAMP